MRNDELYHFGIKGMKWGVRRYQNEDGSLTEKGKKRYSKSKKEDYKSMSDEELKKRVQRLEMEQQYNRLNESGAVRGIRNISRGAGSIAKIRGLSNKKETQDISNTFKKGSEGSGNIADTLSKKMSNKKASEMSDAELKARVDRLNLEQRYRNRSRGAKASGAEWVLNTLDTIGDITAVGVSAVTLYRLIKKRTSTGITIQLSDENDDFLRHFGIKGQKWERKHGPPYPLDYEDHKEFADSEIKEKTKMIYYGNETAYNSLYHYGVKGMKWGVRKDNYEGMANRYYSRKASRYTNKADKLNRSIKTVERAAKQGGLKSKDGRLIMTPEELRGTNAIDIKTRDSYRAASKEYMRRAKEAGEIYNSNAHKREAWKSIGKFAANNYIKAAGFYAIGSNLSNKSTQFGFQLVGSFMEGVGIGMAVGTTGSVGINSARNAIRKARGNNDRVGYESSNYMSRGKEYRRQK